MIAQWFAAKPNDLCSVFGIHMGRKREPTPAKFSFDLHMYAIAVIHAHVCTCADTHYI